MNSTASGTSATPGRKRKNSSVGLSSRSARALRPMRMPSAAPMTVAMTSASTNVTSVWRTAGNRLPSPAIEEVELTQSDGGGKKTLPCPSSSQTPSSTTSGSRPRSGAAERCLRARPARFGAVPATALGGEVTLAATGRPPGLGEVEAGREPAVGQGEQRVQHDADYTGEQHVG